MMLPFGRNRGYQTRRCRWGCPHEQKYATRYGDSVKYSCSQRQSIPLSLRPCFGNRSWRAGYKLDIRRCIYSKKDKYCVISTDCPGKKPFCYHFRCQQCIKDQDCLDDQKCQNGHCVEILATSTEPPQTTRISMKTGHHFQATLTEMHFSLIFHYF